MLTRNRFLKGTFGAPAEFIIANSLATAQSPAIAQDTYKGFVENASAGTLGVYWNDTNARVTAGETALAANKNRSFFYAWKTQANADGVTFTHRSGPIACDGLSYKQVAYSAGTAQVTTVAVGGTMAAGQTLHVKIMDTTAGNSPYPMYHYQAKYNTDVNTTLDDIKALIDAETNEKIVSASVTTTTLTITGDFKNRTFKVVAYVETTAAQPTDATDIVITTTTQAVEPVGTLADVQYFEDFYKVSQGMNTYSGDETVNTSELQPGYASNVSSSVNYGYLIVGHINTELGATEKFHQKKYTVIAIATASVATLAAL